MDFWKFINYFLNRISIFLLITVTVLWWLAYLSNEHYPAPMPEYTLINWDKTVVFQGMSHIGSKDFYNTVAKNLLDFKKKWWVYFYEWVWMWTKENSEKFDKAMWVKFDENLYKHFSKLYWVDNQDQRIFMWLENDLDFNIDINMDQIVEMYEEIPDKPEDNKVPLDISGQLMEELAGLNDKELKILVYINQALLNFIIWSSDTQDFLQTNFANKKLFDVILGKRNEVLAKGIIDSEYNDIYITYWLLHFKWVLELLKKDNSNWKIVSVKNLYPIQ